jgi:hypothetical protein
LRAVGRRRSGSYAFFDRLNRVAAVYFASTRVTEFLVRNAVVSGLVFGVLVHFVMQYIVIPLQQRRVTQFSDGVRFLTELSAMRFWSASGCLISRWSAGKKLVWVSFV